MGPGGAGVTGGRRAERPYNGFQYTGLQLLSLFSIPLSGCGLGVLVFILAQRALKRDGFEDAYARERVERAKLVAGASVILFCMSMVGLVAMGYGHGAKRRAAEAAPRAAGAVQQ